jgi:uncharacterized protein YdbL (DUF1318 family)
MDFRVMIGGALLLLAMPASATAQEPVAVAQARAAGQVGERYDGYIGVVGSIPDSVRRQVGTINIKRRSLYSSLASSKGVTTEEVGITAACSLLRRVDVGEAYNAGQGWRRRGAGQGVALPAYCG